MTARAIWRSEQPSYEQPIWSSQRPATPPSFHLRTPDDRDLDAVTWTRATTKSVTDYQGNIWQALSGEVPWEGYRRVQNLAQASANLSGTGWTLNAATASTSTLLLATAATAVHYALSAIVSAPATGTAFVCSVDLKKYSDTWVQVLAGSSPFANTVWANVNLDTGAFGNKGSTGTWTCVESPDDSTYWRVSFAATTTASLSVSALIVCFTGDADYNGRAPSVSTTTANGVYINRLQIQLARPGQTAPDEYVSVGVLSTPYHGAKVDGVKYFATDDQGRLIDGTRGYDRDGSGAWVESSSVTPIATGLSIGSAQTNRITDSTPATGWTTGTATATASYDAQVGAYAQLRNVGAEGTANVYLASASFTGGARSEIAFMLRTVTSTGLAAVKNPQGSAYGLWTVDLTLVSTTRFERIDRFHAAVTIVNEFTATAGGTAGVSFYKSSGTQDYDVALVTQVEAARVQSLIYSAGSATTKNADVPAFTSMPGYTSNSAGAVVMDFVPLAPTTTAATYIAGPQAVYKASADAKLYQTDSTTSSNFGDQVERTRTKIATSWETGVGRYGYRDGTSKFAATAYDGAWATSTLTLAGPMILRELSIYPTALTATQLQALSNG